MHNKIWTHFAKVILLLSAQIIFNFFSLKSYTQCICHVKIYIVFFTALQMGILQFKEKKNQTIHLIVYDVYEIKAML